MAKRAPLADRAVRIDTMDRARRTCRMSIEALEICVTQLIGEIEDSPKYDKDLVSHLAWLTAQTVPVMNELRQQNKAELREVEQIPLDTVLTFLKSLSRDKLAAVIADLSGADSEEGLL